MSSAFAARVRSDTTAHYHYNMGLALLVSGDPEAARSALTRATAATAHGRASAALRALGAGEAGEAGADDGPRPVSPDTAESPDTALATAGLWRDLGLLLERRGQDAAASGCFTVALTLCPADAESHTCLGDSLRRQGQLDAARAAYRRALHLNGHTGRAVVRLRDLAEDDIRLAESLEQQGEHTAALTAWRAAVATDPDAAPGWEGLASALAASGTASATDIAAAWRAAAAAWQRQNELSAAEGALSRAFHLAPQAEFCTALADLDQRRRLRARAGHLHRLAVTLEPDNAELWLRLGEAYIAADQEAEARDALHRARRLAPDKVGACNALAALCAAQGDPTAAEQWYRAALAIRPLGVWSLVGLGTVLLPQRPAEAETLARQALACVPDFAAAACLLGRSLLRQGRRTAARHALQQAAAGPQLRTALLRDLAGASLEAGLAELAALLLDRLGGRSFDDQQTAAAAGAWYSAVLLQPDLAAAHAGLGLVAERTGDPDAALQAWAQALTLAPERGDLHQARARVLDGLGRPDEAAAARRAALEADVW